MPEKITKVTVERTIKGSRLADSTKQALLNSLEDYPPEKVLEEFKKVGGVPYQTKLQTGIQTR